MNQLTFIKAPISVSDKKYNRIPVKADRWTLAKLRWRADADDGRSFGFELETPLRHHDVVFQSGGDLYYIEQAEESVLVISTDTVKNTEELAWNIGNLHQPLQVTSTQLIAADDSAVTQLLNKQHIPYTVESRVFEPIRAMGTHTHHHHH